MPPELSDGAAPPPFDGVSEGRLPEGALPLTGWRQTFSSLSGNRNFSLLYAGNIAFFFGMQSMFILRGWLVIERWDDASLLGYIMASVALPMLLLAPVGGVVADRVDKRKLILAAQASLVLTNSVIAALILTDAIQFWHLLIVSAFSGAAFSFNMPSRQALVAMLVPRDKLMNATALSTAAMNASAIVAPPLGGVLIASTGIGFAYTVATALFLCAFAATLALPAMPSRRQQRFTFLEDFVGGFSYIKSSPLLLGLLLFTTVPMLFAQPYQTLLPVFADRVWNVGEMGFGILQGAAGVGGLLGALIVANLDTYPKKSRLLLGGALGFGGFLALFALSPSFYLALVFMALVGFSAMTVMTVNNTSIQLIIPDEVRGRVMSVMMMSFGLMPLGAVPASTAAETVGAPAVVAVGAGLFVASVLLLFATIPAFRSLDRRLAEGREREAARRSARRPEGAPAATPLPAAEPSRS